MKKKHITPSRKHGKSGIADRLVREVLEPSSGSNKVDALIEQHNSQLFNQSLDSVPTIVVDTAYQGIKLGSKFYREGDPSDHFFVLRRRTEPIAPGSTQYRSRLFLYSKASSEFVFHYAVTTKFTLVD